MKKRKKINPKIGPYGEKRKLRKKKITKLKHQKT